MSTNSKKSSTSSSKKQDKKAIDALFQGRQINKQTYAAYKKQK
jgi:hypothetical protein